MYKSVHSITNKRAVALFSALIYLMVPYKIADVYKRYAIGEFSAFIFLPVLFAGMYSLFNQDGKKHFYIAIGAIGLILTHTITAFYTAIFCLIYVIFRIVKLKQKEVIKKLIINVIFIILVSSFFIIPMLEAKISADYAIFDSSLMYGYGEYVYYNTLNISEFFKDIGKEEQTTYIIGIPIFVLMCLSIFVYRSVEKKYKYFYIISILFSFISLYASTKYFPWLKMPDILCKLQYPWRMLTFFAFFISFVIGVNIYVLLKKLLKNDIIGLTSSAILLIIMLVYTIPIILQYETEYDLRDEELEKDIIKNPYIQYEIINTEYLPVNAILKYHTYLNKKKDKIYILQGETLIIRENKKDLTYSAIIEDAVKDTIIEFPFFYYPGYKVTLEENGKKEKLETIQTDNGFTGTVITKDISQAKIKIEYKGTLVIYVSYIVSFISFVIFIGYCYIESRKKD